MSVPENHQGYALTRLYSDFDIEKPNTSSAGKGFLNCDQLGLLRRTFGEWFGNLITIKDTNGQGHLVSRKSLEKFLVRTATTTQEIAETSTQDELQGMLDAFVKTTQEKRTEKPTIPNTALPQQPPVTRQESIVPVTTPKQDDTPEKPSTQKSIVSNELPKEPLVINEPKQKEEDAAPEKTSPQQQIVSSEPPKEQLLIHEPKQTEEEAKPESVSNIESFISIEPEQLPTTKSNLPVVEPVTIDKEKARILLQDKTLTDESVISLAGQLGPDIKDRFNQLTTALNAGEFEKEALSLRKILKQAIFIEETIAVNKAADKFIPRQKDIAPRSIQIHDDGTKRIIAVIPKETHAVIAAQGTSKKVLSAIEVPFERIQVSEPIVQITPLRQSERKNDPRSQQAVQKEIDKELEIYEELKDTPGIASIICVSVQTAASIKKGLPSRSILAKRAPKGDLQKVIKEQKSIDLEKQIAWTYRLICTFADVHAKNIIHGDIKGDNILLDNDEMPLVTDFGMACTKKGGKGKDKDNIVPHNMYLKDNLYGTMEYSAPELFCNDNGFTRTATAVDYQKTESFALGAVVYAIMNKGEDLPWMAEIVAVRDSENPDWDSQNEPLRKSMRDGIRDYVENPLKDLPKEENRNREEHYKYVVYSLLRENPNERWTMAQAKDYMENHLHGMT